MVTTAGDWFETRDLSLSRGARLLLDKLAFALAPGEVILLQGQKQRLVLARFALATQEPSRRPLWLLDEPSAALDRSGATMLDGLLGQHLDHGGAAIVATHLPVLADAVDRRLHRLELG